MVGAKYSLFEAFEPLEYVYVVFGTPRQVRPVNFLDILGPYSTCFCPVRVGFQVLALILR